jgi:phi13 family phage major tail protein
MSSREVKIGLKRAYYAIMTQDNEGAPLYNAPVAFKGIQQVGITPRVATVDIPADDDVETINETSGADISIQKKYLSTDEESILLGKRKIGNMVVGGDTDDPPCLAFGYMRTLANGSGLYVWILKMKFSDSASTADTKQPETINPQYDTLSGRSQKRVADGCWIFKEESSELNFVNTWFTKEKLETLGNMAATVYGNPATVQFISTLPASGQAGVIYVDTTDDKSYYWNGTEFVENGSAE